MPQKPSETAEQIAEAKKSIEFCESNPDYTPTESIAAVDLEGLARAYLRLLEDAKGCVRWTGSCPYAGGGCSPANKLCRTICELEDLNDVEESDE